MDIDAIQTAGDLSPQQQLREQLIMQAFSNALSAEEISRAVQIAEREQATTPVKQNKAPAGSQHLVDILV